MYSTFTSMRMYSLPGAMMSNKQVLKPRPRSRYNKGDKVLGREFGDHIGDW